MKLLSFVYCRDAIVGSLMKEVQAVNLNSSLDGQRSSQFNQSTSVMTGSIGTPEEAAPVIHTTSTPAAQPTTERGDINAMGDSAHSDVSIIHSLLIIHF